MSQRDKGLKYSKPLNLEVTHDSNHFKGTMDEFMGKTVESSKLL